jgi:hypothetical protein
MSPVLASWLRWLRGEHVVRSREEACRAEGIADPEALAFALALVEAANACRERRDPSSPSRPAQVACCLAARALEIVRDKCPFPSSGVDGVAEERVAELLARAADPWTLADPLADRTAKEALAEVGRRLRPFARTLERFARSRAVARLRPFAFGAPLVVVLSLLAGFVYVKTRPPNLLAACPFRTSSASDEFDAKAHTWHGTAIPVFFVTRNEPEPWIEYDLGRPSRLRRVVAGNRTDCCRDWAVPLVLELSDDQKHWREIARVTQEFYTWDARFPVETGRYLRLRVSRTTVFQLASVEAYER